jgi:hypothetical protein
MKVTTTKAIGANAIEVSFDAKDAKELITVVGELAFLDRIPNNCNECDSTNLTLGHREAKGYDFYEAKCLGCGASLKIGESKAGPMFIKYGSSFVKFKGTGTSTNDGTGDAEFNPEDI